MEGKFHDLIVYGTKDISSNSKNILSTTIKSQPANVKKFKFHPIVNPYINCIKPHNVSHVCNFYFLDCEEKMECTNKQITSFRQ